MYNNVNFEKIFDAANDKEVWGIAWRKLYEGAEKIIDDAKTI